MVTGKGKNRTGIYLKHFGPTHFFEHIATGSSKGARKAEGIELILELLKGIKKEEDVYIGDAQSDIIASRKAGISGV